MKHNFEEILSKIKSMYPPKDFLALHEPQFKGNERKYVLDAIESTFVSSVGAYVDLFEQKMCEITGAKFAIATVNGTNALHLALVVSEVEAEDEVLTQSLTFIATLNAIKYIGADPVFIDVDKDTMGLSPESLSSFLKQHAELRTDGFTYNKNTGKRIKACVPMHTFGFVCRIDEIAAVCEQWNIRLVEDAAESLGSYDKGVHSGRKGLVSAFSFNGNKTVTAGGGGALITDNEELAIKAKHLSTQAKVPHKWEFKHDCIGYNYRMPNLNAALVCAQLEQLPAYIKSKRELAKEYADFFKTQEGVSFVEEIENTEANYWLNCILLPNKEERDQFLDYTNSNGVMTRPCWELMHTLDLFNHHQKTDMNNSEWIAERLVNIPSSARL